MHQYTVRWMVEWCSEVRWNVPMAHVSMDNEDREKVVNALLKRDSGEYVAK